MHARLQDTPQSGEPKRARAIGPVRLPAGWRFTIYFIALGVWFTGAVWLILHYFFVRHGEFGDEPHPAAFPMIAAHAGFAFLTLILAGALWERHISRALKGTRRLASGIAMLSVLTILAGSGFALYYIGGDTARAITSALHWGLGLAAPVFFFLHRFAHR